MNKSIRQKMLRTAKEIARKQFNNIVYISIDEQRKKEIELAMINYPEFDKKELTKMVEEQIKKDKNLEESFIF